MEFYNKLQILRKQANLTQDELALKIGVSRQAISKWESGGAYPDLNNIQTLCAFFSVSADTLMNPKYETPTPEVLCLEFDGNELGGNIKRIRSARGITQEAFAEQMKVSRQSVSKWENGSVIPKTEIIVLMLDVLQAEFSELFPPVCVKENDVMQDEEKNSESSENGEKTHSRPKKKAAKIIVAVSAAVLLLVATAAVIIWYILYGPFLKPYYFKEDFGEIFLETDKLDSLSDKLKAEGAEITLGSGDDFFTVKIDSNEENFSIVGLNGEEAIFIPRKDTAAQLEQSVFNPNGKSQFALSVEEYNRYIYIIRLISAEEGENEKAIENVLKKCESIAAPEEKFSFAEGKFALKKTVSYKIDKEKLLLMLDAVSEEEKNSVSFEALCNITGIADILSEMKKEINKNIKSVDISFDYCIDGGRMTDAVYSCNIIYNDNTVSNSSFEFKFTYGDKPMLEITKKSSENISGIFMAEESRYIYSKEIFSNGLKFSLHSESSSEMEVDGKTQRYKTSGNFTLDYNSETKEFFAYYNVPETKTEAGMEMKIFGVWELDDEAGKWSFAINYVESDGEVLSGKNTFSISVKSLGEAEFPKAGKNLFALSENEMRTLYRNLPVKQFEGLLESLTGEKPEFTYSIEGSLVPFDAELDAMEYQEYFIEYYKSQSEEVKQFDTKNIYIYDEKYGVYVLIIRNGATITNVKYAYELNENILSGYHKAEIENKKLKVHNPVHTKTIEASCTQDGKEIYSCLDCNKEYSIITSNAHCEIKMCVEKAVWVDGVTYDMVLNKCNACGYIYDMRLELEGNSIMNAWLERKPDGTYILAVYSQGTIFSLPESLLNQITISEMNIDVRNAPFIFVPNGVKIIKEGSFTFNHTLQTVVLPSTLTKIEEGAFADAPLLHTIYYCGTAEQWANVNIGTYAEKWADVDIIFAPEGVSPEVLMKSYDNQQ